MDLHRKIHGFKEHLANRHMTRRIGFKSTARIHHFTLDGTFHSSAHKKCHRTSCDLFTNPPNAIIRLSLSDSRKPECFLEQMRVFIIWKHTHICKKIITHAGQWSSEWNMRVKGEWIMVLFTDVIFYASVNLVSSGPDNGLSPIRRQAIIETNAGLLSIGPLETNFSSIVIKIHIFSLTKMHLQISFAKRRPFCPGDELSNPVEYSSII